MPDARLTAAAEELVARVDHRAPLIDLRGDVAEIDAVLRDAGDGGLSALPMAKLLCARARTVAAAGDPTEAIAGLQELVDTYGGCTEPSLRHEVDFALMSTARLQLANVTLQRDGFQSYDRLIARAREAPADEFAPFKARMVLDVVPMCLGLEAFQRAASGCDAVLLIAGGLADRRDLIAEATFLSALSSSSGSKRPAAAAELEVLHAMGEPALVALERLSHAHGTPRQWRFAVYTNRAIILASLGRKREAVIVAVRAAALAPGLILAEGVRRAQHALHVR